MLRVNQRIQPRSYTRSCSRTGAFKSNKGVFNLVVKNDAFTAEDDLGDRAVTVKG